MARQRYQRSKDRARVSNQIRRVWASKAIHSRSRQSSNVHFWTIRRWSLRWLRITDSNLSARSFEDEAGASKNGSICWHVRCSEENLRSRRPTKLLPRIYSQCLRWVGRHSLPTATLNLTALLFRLKVLFRMPASISQFTKHWRRNIWQSTPTSKERLRSIFSSRAVPYLLLSAKFALILWLSFEHDYKHKVRSLSPEDFV